jgi:hypothetical protein
MSIERINKEADRNVNFVQQLKPKNTKITDQKKAD